MSSSKKTTQQAQTTNTLDPWVKSLLGENYNFAKTAADQPFQAYSQPRFADFTPAQTAGQQQALDVANNNVGGSTMDAAIAAAKASAGYTPSMVTAPTAASGGYTGAQIGNVPGAVGSGYDAATLANPQGFGDIDISKYMNPYQQQVIDTANADFNNQRLLEQNQNAANATLAGAWRGDALGVTQGVTNQGWDRTLATTDANLRNQGWNSATGLATDDLNRLFQAQQANQAAQNAASAFGASAGNTASLANSAQAMQAAQANQGSTNAADAFTAAAGNQASLANAQAALAAAQGNQGAGLTAAQLNSQAGQLLAGMSGDQLQQALQRATATSQVGQQQQQQQQQQLNFNWDEFLRQQQYPQQQLAMRNSALGLIPALTNQNTSGSSTTTSSNPMGTIGSLLGGAAALGFAPFSGGASLAGLSGILGGLGGGGASALTGLAAKYGG